MDDTPRPTFAGRLRVQDFLYTGDVGERRGKRRVDETEEETANKREAEANEATNETANETIETKETENKTAKRQRSSKYAPPSTYAHLDLLPDALAPHLLVLFVGLNPGVQTARTGHAYAHPSNLFWKLLYRSGVTPVACRAEEDRTLPARFRLGLTNIVERPSRNGGELRPAELDAGVAVLEAKVRRWRPEAVCLVGKSIWQSIVRVRYGRLKAEKKRGRGKDDGQAGQPRQPPEFSYGWQDESENMGKKTETGTETGTGTEAGGDDLEEGVYDDPDWNGARVFVASSTSGLAATLSPAEKEAIWRQLGSWVEERRTAIETETGYKWK